MGNANMIDSGEFRKALGAFTTGVTVVTTRAEDGQDVGLTANSFNSVSLDPPMVLWSLGKSAGSLPVFTAAEYFAVHILAEDQQALSGQFATRGIDKFAGVDLTRGPNDIPLLSRCAARFVCRTAFKYEGGDHIIFVGEVIEFDHNPMPPLLFHSGQYAQLSKKYAQNSDLSNDFLGYLLGRCYQQLFAPVKQALAGHSLSVAQYYLFPLLLQFDNKTFQQLQDILRLGDYVISEEELQDLKNRGLVESIAADGREVLRLTEKGKELNMELASMVKAIEADAEKDLDYDQRQSLKLSLRQLIETTNPGPPESWKE